MKTHKLLVTLHTEDEETAEQWADLVQRILRHFDPGVNPDNIVVTVAEPLQVRDTMPAEVKS